MRSFFLILLVLIASNLHAQTFVFRYDDVLLSNDLTKDPVIQLFRKYNIPLNLAVIPFFDTVKQPNPETIRFIQKEVENKNIDIQLHGFTHRTSDSAVNEFDHLSVAQQYVMLKSGREYLDSVLNITIEGFVPPYDSYNANTIAALTKLQFKFISAGKYGDLIDSDIAYFPAT